MHEALVAHGLSLALGGRMVLHDVSFSAHFGELLSIVGPNGAGKSTLLRALSGLLPSSTGEITLEGQSLRTLSQAERARRVSFVPQQSQLSAALSVRDVVSLGRYAHRPGLSPLHGGALLPRKGSMNDERAVAQAMLDTDVSALSERGFSELSTGEQKRVLIARALCTEARTLLLDEPTASLDIEHALRLFGLLRALAAEGRAVVLVLHQLEHALAFSDRALLLSQGRVLASGVTREVLTPEHVLQLHRVELVPNAAPGFRLPSSGSAP